MINVFITLTGKSHLTSHTNEPWIVLFHMGLNDSFSLCVIRLISHLIRKHDSFIWTWTYYTGFIFHTGFLHTAHHFFLSSDYLIILQLIHFSDFYMNHTCVIHLFMMNFFSHLFITHDLVHIKYDSYTVLIYIHIWFLHLILLISKLNDSILTCDSHTIHSWFFFFTTDLYIRVFQM